MPGLHYISYSSKCQWLLFASVMLISTYPSFFFFFFSLFLDVQILLHVFINFILLLLTRFFNTPRRKCFLDRDSFCKNFVKRNWYRRYKYFQRILSETSLRFSFYALRAKIFGSNVLTKRYLLDIRNIRSN